VRSQKNLIESIRAVFLYPQSLRVGPVRLGKYCTPYVPLTVVCYLTDLRLSLTLTLAKADHIHFDDFALFVMPFVEYIRPLVTV